MRLHIVRYILLLRLQIIHKYYRKMNATLGHDQRFEFESDQIRLNIPSTGTTTSDKAWRITALGPPVVCPSCYHSLDKLLSICIHILIIHSFDKNGGILLYYAIKMCKEFLLCMCVGGGVHILC